MSLFWCLPALIHLRFPLSYVWRCYFGSQPGAVVKNRPRSWPGVSYLRASSYDYATCVEGSPVVGVPWFCQIPALFSCSFIPEREEKPHTHTLPSTGGGISSPRPWNCLVQWIQAWDLEGDCLGSWLCHLQSGQVHLSGPLFLPLQKENINST